MYQKKIHRLAPRSCRRALLAVTAAVLMASCGEPATNGVAEGANASAPVAEEPAITASPEELHATRIEDLAVVQAAVEAYFNAEGAYPSTDENWRGVAFGHAPGANWIPGLVPDHIDELPRDPELGETKAEPQYIYISNGAGYKLIVHNVNDVEMLSAESGFEIDPVRPNSGYGFWTEDMVDF
ncbi:MAG: hypothetical protein AAGH87_11120 [Pseudomonadota bacterium]